MSLSVFIHYLIALYSGTLRPTVFKWYLSRTEQSRSFPLPHSQLFSRLFRHTSTDIFFFHFWNRKKSLQVRSGKQTGCGVFSYPFRSIASIVCVDSRVVLLQYTLSGLTSLHSTLKWLSFPLLKSTYIITHVTSQNTVANTLLARSYVLNIFGLRAKAILTDISVP